MKCRKESKDFKYKNKPFPLSSLFSQLMNLQHAFYTLEARASVIKWRFKLMIDRSCSKSFKTLIHITVQLESKMSIESVSPKKGEIAFVWFNPYSGVALKTPTKTLLIDPAEIDPKKL